MGNFWGNFGDNLGKIFGEIWVWILGNLGEHILGNCGMDLGKFRANIVWEFGYIFLPFLKKDVEVRLKYA